jgi:hypothetical protein
MVLTLLRNKSVKVLTMECSSDITIIHIVNWGRRGRDRMVVGFNTTYAISAYYPTDVGIDKIPCFYGKIRKTKWFFLHVFV